MVSGQRLDRKQDCAASRPSRLWEPMCKTHTDHHKQEKLVPKPASAVTFGTMSICKQKHGECPTKHRHKQM